jgi:glycosyltransferase involved in cell wall biosynthesis
MPKYRAASSAPLMGRLEQGSILRSAAASWTERLRSAEPVRPYYALSPQLAITPRVSVIIPALNEAANLPHVFATIPSWVHEVVLVDGRSTDDTVETARRLLPDIVVVTQQGWGKGDALLAGFEACTGEIIVMMDADGSTDGGEIVRFVAALVAGADFAKGSRFACGGGSSDITFARAWGNRRLADLVNKLFGTCYTDLCYGYNAFWADQLKVLEIDCAGFEIEAMLNIRAASRGLRILEVPSFELPRVHGASNLRVFKDGWRIARLIVREWRLHRQSRPDTSAVAANVLGDDVDTATISVGRFGPAAPDLSTAVQ